jgi:3-phosphoshikimate 1-carboxyvinyltransferase
MAFTPGTRHIYNASRLALKESNRLRVVAETLTALGAEIQETADGLRITGKPTLPGGVTVDSAGDHRIAMAVAIAALRCARPVLLTNAQAQEKSYPAFWEIYENLRETAAPAHFRPRPS